MAVTSPGKIVLRPGVVRFPTAIAASVIALFVRDAGAPAVATVALPEVVVAPPTPLTPPTPPVSGTAPIDASIAAAVPPSTNIGSAKCGDCHDKELKGWQASWHARALSPAKREFVVGNFANAHFTGSSSEAWMKRAGADYEMRAHGPDGGFADFKVDWVIGGKRMQDNVTVFPDGRWQVLPVYFHVTDHAWVDYTETKQGALTPEHPFYWTNARRMANHECLDCHTTGLKVSYDANKRHWDTSFVDASVACEDCHGAGSRHAETSEPRDIIHPVKAKQLGMTACARCHGPRNPLFPLLDSEHQFRLGTDSYDEFYDPIVVVLPQQGVSSDFFADGRPRTSSFEYQALVQSACFRSGGVTCLDCHTAPHAGKRHAELRDDDPDASCKRCHPGVSAAHGHHKKVTCVQCHMAPVVSGVLDRFADHAIDIPVPQNTERHDIPSACGVCHADRKVADLEAAVAQWWPDADKRQARRLRLADAIDDATAKDSAPALLAVVGDKAEAPTLRGAAAILLGRRFGPRTARAIAPLLASDNILLRAKACEALAAAHAGTEVNAVAAKLADPSLRVRLTCAIALYDLGDARGTQALEQLAAAPETSRLSVPHIELASVRGRANDLAGARAELTKVVELMPYYTDALLRLAGVSAELGDFAEAHRRVDQALALEPNHRGAKALKAKLP